MRDPLLRVGTIALVVGLLASWPQSLRAQDGWQATLIVDPLPSPYLSDWEVDVTIGELIVTNTTTTTTDITIYYALSRNGQVLLNGVTDPQTVLANESVVFNSDSDIGGEVDWDTEFENLLVRTGRLPEGEYEGCVTIVDPNGLVLVDRECVRFSTLYPDPPFLVYPFDGDTITTQDPIFEWLPVQVPALEDFRVGYVLAIAEVNTEARQLPEVALESNILHYVEPDLLETSHQYPVGALPFQPGHTYAWRVQALDGEGVPISANNGRSEVWTFVYEEAEAEVEQVVASVDVTPGADTLRFVGDTLRFNAAAYDPDNLEIRGRHFEWRSSDTTIAKVDSVGVVTAVGGGEAKIVALLDGIADTALSVTSVPTGLTVGFELYDPDGATPSLLELIQSGSFEDVVPQLVERLQAGEFRIPIPRIASLWGDDEGGDVPPGGGPDAPRGPNVDLVGFAPNGLAADDCSQMSFDVTYELDSGKRVLVLELSLAKTTASLVTANCMAPKVVLPPDTAWTASALFAVTWSHPGLPRAFLALKGIGQLPLPLGGTEAHVRYLVVNPLRTVTLESDVLPEKYAGFFGAESFDAGLGVTYYSKRRCVDDTKRLCQLLSWINPDDPEITLQAFAGVTASETSVGKPDSPEEGRVGSSVALGFSIQASLPVRHIGWDVLGLSLDSTQAGLFFAVQDSINQTTIRDSDNQWSDTTQQGWSIGVAPTLKAWLTGSQGNQWEVTGSIGLEWDPTAEEARKPKVVVSAQLSAVWQFWWLRLGNPTVVFTTPLGSREEREATTLALSGTWGFGENGGVGLDTTLGGGGIRGDVGGAPTSGAQGFESLGRGQITLSWTRLRLASEQSRAAAKEVRDSATMAVTRHLHVVRDARARVPPARFELGLAREDGRREKIQAAQTALEEAIRDSVAAETELQRLRSEREQAREALVPQACWKTVRGRCLNWTGRLSVGNGSATDLLAMLVRFLTGTQ